MIAWTWRAWPDPLIDFGRELYVAWRLSEGDALYTDIAWFNGPLSPHWNGLLFQLFGPGLSVLVWGNVLVLAAAVGMVYALVARLTDGLTATVAGLLFLLVFACGQYVGIGNYNWITPYSHEVTHGSMLALASVVALERWARTGAVGALAVGGAAVGLSFLTKPEPFAAALAASAVLLGPTLWRRDVRALGIFLSTALVPVAASAVLVGPAGTWGAWPSVLDGDVAALPFYREGMGLDVPGIRAAEVAAWSAIWLLALTAALGLAWLARGTRSRVLAPVAGAASLLVMAQLGDRYDWTEVVRPLALVSLVALVVLAVVRWRGARTHANLLALALSAFAFTNILKMLLDVRVAHYGFALALPAALLAVTALVGWLPRWLDGRGARGDVFRACVLALLAVFAARHLEATNVWLGRKTEWVAEGRDAFRSDARGTLVNAAVAHVRASGAASLAVVPEGVIINYLARTPAPTPFVTFMPPEEIMFGSEVWTERFRASPPELVLIVPRDLSEYGQPPFGSGFARSLAAWIRSEFVTAGTLHPPGAPYGAEILVRRPAG
ncbi:MAG: glycosyltransferase family 39 protein [Longimicrobiales bacterium]